MSGRKFRVFGGYRTSAQAISYEVVLITILLLVCIIIDFLNISVLGKNFQDRSIFFFMVGLFIC